MHARGLNHFPLSEEEPSKHMENITTGGGRRKERRGKLELHLTGEEEKWDRAEGSEAMLQQGLEAVDTDQEPAVRVGEVEGRRKREGGRAVEGCWA